MWCGFFYLWISLSYRRHTPLPSHPLISCPSILEAKWHYHVTIDSLFDSESGFGHIFRSHLDLVIFRKTIHEGHQSTSYRVIYQDINVGEKEVILKACLIQVSKIHTHPYLSILLRYGHDIVYPLGLVYGFDEPYL